MEDRRKSKRLELDSTLIMKSLNASGGTQEVQIEVVDLSKTGIGFTCAEPLMIGTIYEAYLVIWTKEKIHVFLEIVRIEKRQEDYNYGATFVGMPGMDASRIATYDVVNTELRNQEK